jgi:hypothetical protein
MVYCFQISICSYSKEGLLFYSALTINEGRLFIMEAALLFLKCESKSPEIPQPFTNYFFYIFFISFFLHLSISRKTRKQYNYKRKAQRTFPDLRDLLYLFFFRAVHDPRIPTVASITPVPGTLLFSFSSSEACISSFSSDASLALTRLLPLSTAGFISID